MVHNTVPDSTNSDRDSTERPGETRRPHHGAPRRPVTGVEAGAGIATAVALAIVLELILWAYADGHTRLEMSSAQSLAEVMFALGLVAIVATLWRRGVTLAQAVLVAAGSTAVTFLTLGVLAAASCMATHCAS